MERRLLPSTVALALALGTVSASAQTRRPSDQDRNMNPPQSTQAQPSGQMRAEPQPGAAAQRPRMPQAGEQAQGTPQPQPNARTQNPAPQRPSAPTGQSAPPQNAPAANNQTQPAAGQAQNQPPPQQGAAGQDQAQPGQARPGMAQQPGNAAGTANSGAGGASGNANANANAPHNAAADQPQGNQHGVITLTEQQNTRVSQAVRQANVQPLINVSFSIAVGTTIPNDVQLHVLPPAMVEVVPEYRGYSFVVVEQEALIIDPDSRAIVAVIPFEAQQTTGVNTAPPPAPAPAQAAAPPPRERKKLDLTRDQREILRRQAQRHHKAEKDKHVIIEERRTTTGAGNREPRVGDRVPDGAIIEGRPVEIYRDEPPVRDDRHHPSVRDIPLIGPLFGRPDED